MITGVEQGAPSAEWHDARLDLPDDETTVLCCDAGTDTYWIGFHEEGFWFEAGGDDEIDVTHWMHLPETP
jgi:hypothetical protein